jgi:hypothetical protein
METIKSNYGSEIDLNVNYRRYRFLQILFGYREYYIFKNYTEAEFHELWRLMRVWEKLVYGSSLWIGYKLIKLIPQDLTKKIAQLFMKIIGQYPKYEIKSSEATYGNILEVFDKVEPVHLQTNQSVSEPLQGH